MKKNILMIYPEFPTTYWSFKHSVSFLGKKSQFPPLGLITIAAMLPPDYDIRLIDMNVARLKDKDILAADLVFVSAMIVQKESFEKVIETCNRLGRPVVAGGPYPTTSFDKIRGVDHFVLNEGEETLPEFIKDYETGGARHVYSNSARPDITKTPVPRFDLLDIKKYFSMIIQFSRGCPFNCEFCDIIELFGHNPRTKNPDQFLREMDAIYDTGYSGNVFVVDDNFIGNKRNVKLLLPEIDKWQKSRKKPFNLFTQASVNLAEDEELMSMMVSCGFDMVFLGIETPVEETLVFTQKKQNTKRSLLESVRKIQNMGIEVSAGFIIGFDKDPEDIFDLQFRFIQESGIVMSMVGLMIALPNTQLYRRLTSENRMLMETAGNNTHILDLNFVPVMDKYKIIAGYKNILSKIYSPKYYFERCLTSIKNIYKSGSAYGNFKWIYIRAFIVSLIRQTLSTYSFRYLKFLFTVLFTKPSRFPEAVKMAIMLNHFNIITKKLIHTKNKTVEIPVGTRPLIINNFGTGNIT